MIRPVIPSVNIALVARVTLLLLVAINSRAEDSLVILQYHHVSTDTPSSTSVTPQQFEQHLELIEQLGIEVVALDWALDRIFNRQSIPQPAVAISFDDGYRSVLTEVHPRLKARDWPYTLFTTPPKTETGTELLLGWKELKQLRQEGVLIANHSLNHQHLIRQLPGETKSQWRQRIAIQLETAKQRLDRQLGTTPLWLAYPYGEYTVELQQLLESLGWLGFGQHSGPVDQHSDRQALPRFPASGRYSELASLQDKLLSLAMPLASGRTEPVTNGFGRWQVRLKRVPFTPSSLNCFSPGGVQQQPQWHDSLSFSVSAELPVGRSRINCTAKVPGQQRFYWLSQPWFTPSSDGRWVHD